MGSYLYLMLGKPLHVGFVEDQDDPLSGRPANCCRSPGVISFIARTIYVGLKVEVGRQPGPFSRPPRQLRLQCREDEVASVLLRRLADETDRSLRDPSQSHAGVQT
jgi:hypothetical protein